jgi:hypothetical protein
MLKDQKGHFKIWERAGATILPVFISLTEDLAPVHFEICEWQEGAITSRRTDYMPLLTQTLEEWTRGFLTRMASPGLVT